MPGLSVVFWRGVVCCGTNTEKICVKKVLIRLHKIANLQNFLQTRLIDKWLGKISAWFAFIGDICPWKVLPVKGAGQPCWWVNWYRNEWIHCSYQVPRCPRRPSKFMRRTRPVAILVKEVIHNLTLIHNAVLVVVIVGRMIIMSSFCGGRGCGRTDSNDIFVFAKNRKLSPLKK